MQAKAKNHQNVEILIEQIIEKYLVSFSNVILD